MITTDELFSEDFEPEWMQRRHYRANVMRLVGLYTVAALWLLNDALDILSRRESDARIDYNYRATATEQRLRLISRCDTRGNYRNGSFVESKYK